MQHLKTDLEEIWIISTGNNPSGYFEKNKTKRFSTQFSFDQSIGEKGHLNVKNSFSYFNRSIDIPDYRFNGTQNSTFTEANYSRPGESNEWIAGINLWTDNFHEEQLTAIPKRDYKQTTYGVFAQDIWKANDWLHIESGLRGDYVQDYGFVFLPRVSRLI